MITPDETIIMAENRGLREEIVKAQAACMAWLDVFQTIEAHLLDRINMRDEAEPQTYLNIIRASIGELGNTSNAIARARWADASRLQAEIDHLRTRLSSSIEDADNVPSPVNSDQLLASIAISLKRLADHFVPTNGDLPPLLWLGDVLRELKKSWP